MIRIGVSACFLYPDPQRPVFSPKTLSYLENELARFLSSRDTLPILIPDLEDSSLKKLLQELDGFIFPGGSDIAPQTYGEKPIDPQRWPGDPYRDAYELKLLDFAIRNKKPVLGICRGCQLINVYQGGTLYQDIATQCHTAPHRDTTQYDKLSHPVAFEEGGILHQIYQNAGTVNSVHHQGIKQLGKNLRVEARSPKDQLIEAVSSTDPDRFLLGVQWHPEFSATLKGKVLPPEPLYDYFLEEVAKPGRGQK